MLQCAALLALCRVVCVLCERKEPILYTLCIGSVEEGGVGMGVRDMCVEVYVCLCVGGGGMASVSVVF